ncbi:serine/threonine protein kinase, partial [Myxococcota bacterium]|nr:serine/threonine protein kinase [Myxococcota bacterium]
MARYIGDYEVIRELGSGHYGAVYLAVGETPARGRNPAKRRVVAVKKLHRSDPRSVDLLSQEFALLDQVKHRGIVRVYELLEDEGAVVMEHIHGQSLKQVLEELARAKEQVFTEAAVEIGCELADALYQAYTTPGDNGEPLRLVHRDLKPANVMLTPQGEVKILDFGLARVDNADFARDDKGRVKGTPVYMAPEQARGEEIDHRTDLFALGLILYELLRNAPAYAAPKGVRDPVGDLLRAIEKGDLSRQCGELEARLPAHGPIVSRLLQRRPEDRYQTGHDALVDLRRQLYRDRGSYLAEFCEFYFGAVVDIGEAPGIDEAVVASRGTARGRRLSIEERLKQSMAREQKAVQAAGRGGASAPSPAPAAAPPAPAAP